MQIGKYQLGELLGQGGMGAVYHSTHPVLNRPVAIKLMLGSLAADPQSSQRFLREAQVVATLSHPNIVNIFDVDLHHGQPYIVMDFVQGGSLADRLRAGPLTVPEALRLAIPLAEALEYAHRQGLVHRDLKPANVLLQPDGSPVLADFGLARQAQPDGNAQLTATGAVMGTLAYMAPEQFSGRPTDARADVYSFGVMLYELLVGALPFTGDSAQLMYGHLQQPPPPPRARRPDMPQALEQLVLRMLSKDPAWRPQSMAEVAAALRTIEQGGASTGPTIALVADAPPPGGLSPSARGLIALAIGGVVLLIALAVGALLALRPGGGASAPTAVAARPSPRPTFAEFDPPATPVAADTPVPAPAPALVRDALLTDPQPVGPEPFSVGGVSYRKDEDSVWFFGEVRNDAKQARESVAVRVILRDGAGNELASKQGFADLDYLEPGQVAPFSVLFTKDDAPPPFESYDFEVISKQADFQLGYSYRQLELAGPASARRDEYGFVKVSGRVKNVGERPAQYIEIIGVFYDGAGRVVGITSSFADLPGESALAAGAEARFDLQGVVFSAPATRYRLVLQGSKAS